MSVPISGFIVMAITLWFLLTRPDDLVILAIVLHAFAAAAVINMGGSFPIGLTPYFFVASLVTLRIIPSFVTGRIIFFEGEAVTFYLRVLAIFVVLCVASAFILPNLFESLLVDVPRMGVTSHRQIPLAPLRWSMSNGGQAVYMVLNFCVVLEFLSKCGNEKFSLALSNAFAFAGILAAGVGMFQVVCAQTGIKFPVWFFNSNAVWSQATEQTLAGGFRRMSASFVEPSAAGGFFACWMVFEFTLAVSLREAELRHWLFATIATIALFFTTSSTGYVIAGTAFSVALLQTALSICREGVLRIKRTVAIIGAIGSATLGSLLVPRCWDLLNSVLFEKQSTDSAIDRGATLGRAVVVFIQTWGLGAGLGSNRAMSIALYVLSNLGLIGTMLFAYILLKPYLMARMAVRSHQTSKDLRAFVRASRAAFAANVVGMLISGAEITGAQFWLLLGMVLAGVRQSWLFEHGILSLPLDLSAHSNSESLLVKASHEVTERVLQPINL